MTYSEYVMISSPPQQQRQPDDTPQASSVLRVVHAVLSMDVGGLERMVLNLVRGGKPAGQEITILCVEKPGTLAADANSLGAKVISLGKPAGYLPEYIEKAEKELALLKADVVHTHQIGALLYVGQSAKRLGIPVIVHTEHTDHLGNTKGLLRKLKNHLLWRKAAKVADRFYCVSADIQKTAGRFGTIPQAKMEVIRNGIDTNAFTDRSFRAAVRREFNIPHDAPVVCTVGRLSEVKRQDVFLKGIAEARKTLPKLHSVLVGDGPERAALEALCKTLQLETVVRFAGYQSQPERFLAAADIFALTSRQEALPMAILEAWATGLPVVCSAVGGIPHLITERQNGLLFPSLDAVAFGKCLVELVIDSNLASKLSSEGQKKVRAEYSLEAMTEAYTSRYHQLLTARRS